MKILIDIEVLGNHCAMTCPFLKEIREQNRMTLLEDITHYCQLFRQNCTDFRPIDCQRCTDQMITLCQTLRMRHYAMQPDMKTWANNFIFNMHLPIEVPLIPYTLGT